MLRSKKIAIFIIVTLLGCSFLIPKAIYIKDLKKAESESQIIEVVNKYPKYAEPYMKLGDFYAFENPKNLLKIIKKL